MTTCKSTGFSNAKSAAVLHRSGPAFLRNTYNIIEWNGKMPQLFKYYGTRPSTIANRNQITASKLFIYMKLRSVFMCVPCKCTRLVGADPRMEQDQQMANNKIDLWWSINKRKKSSHKIRDWWYIHGNGLLRVFMLMLLFIECAQFI